MILIIKGPSMKRCAHILVFVAGALALSCRSLVFEDRVDCPKYIYLDVLNGSRFDAAEKVSVGVAWSRSGVVSDTYSTTLGDIRGHRFYVSGRRGEAVAVCGAVGFGQGEPVQGSCWTVGEGREFPQLFRFAGSVNDPEEGLEVPVELIKEYCEVTVRFSGYKEKDMRGGLSPFTVSVGGNSCGVDALTGIPVLGNYVFRPGESEAGVFRFRVPRQLDEWLSMTVGLKEGVTGYGAVAREISLWNQFRLLGNITWDEKNLPDVVLHIDVNGPTYRIGIVSWDEADIVDMDYGKGLEQDVGL